MARADPGLLALFGEDGEDDFVVAHRMTRAVRAAGRKAPAAAPPPPHVMKQLSTIQEESFSSLESAPDCSCADDSVEIPTSPGQERGPHSPPASRQLVGAATPRRQRARGAERREPLGGPAAADAASTDTAGGASRGARSFCVAVVSAAFVDAILFAVSRAWAPALVASLVLLGTVVGMVAAAALWCLAGPPGGGGGGGGAGAAIVRAGPGGDDADSVSHCTHFPDPGAPRA
jgi:hypothetical protein